MDLILKYGFQSIKLNFDREEALGKGRKLFESRHVSNVVERRKQQASSSQAVNLGLEPFAVITSEVLPQTSISKPSYKVTINVDENRDVCFTYCTCKAGRGICKHIISTCFYVNSFDSTVSKTSKEKTWGVPTATQRERYKKGALICDLFKVDKLPPITNVEPKIDLDIFKTLNCPLGILLQTKESIELEVGHLLGDIISNVEIEVEKSTVLDISHVVIHKQMLSVPYNVGTVRNLTEKEFKLFNEKILIKSVDLFDIMWKTKDQSKCEEWHDTRKLRISASSKPHRIKIRRKDEASLACSLVNSKTVQTASMRYGLKMEEAARRYYESVTKNKVIEVGIIVRVDSPWLCCSPDGLVLCGENLVLLEIKSPSTCSQKNIIEHDKNISNVPYLLKEGSSWVLKKSHVYYTQVQISLYVTGADICHLMVYSQSRNSELILVPKDEVFLNETIPKLEKFYFKFYLKELVKQFY